jgi:hypothetical protein
MEGFWLIWSFASTSALFCGWNIDIPMAMRMPMTVLRGYQKGRSSWRSNRKPIQSYFQVTSQQKMKNKMQLILQNIAKHITLSKGEGVLFCQKEVRQFKAKSILLNTGEISEHSIL